MLQSFQTWLNRLTQIAGISLWPAQAAEVFDTLHQRLADVGGLGADVRQNDHVRVKTLLLMRQLCPTNEIILLHFALDRITGFIKEITLPDLLTQCIAAQLFLLVIGSVQSDHV